MSASDAVSARMREDWDRRAREDASYYVAFGRRGQSREEFFDTAADVLRALREEYRRFPPETDFKQLTALEIGCGPGRLMAPLSREFGRVWGVDVSGEMLALARENLRDTPSAEVRLSGGADLAGFPDGSVDFCYSYAVFQHIPDKAVVLGYLREAWRVMRPGAVLKFQINGLPGGERGEAVAGWSLRAGVVDDPEVYAAAADTWSGVRFRAEEVAEALAELGFQVLAMDGFETQYLWVTARKPAGEVSDVPGDLARIVRVTNTFTADTVVPCSGRFASASLWALGLEGGADLRRLRVEIDGQQAAPSFIGKHVWIGPTQVNVYLPPGVRTGMVPVRLLLDGRPVSEVAAMRVIPAGPLVPRLIHVSDGVNLLSTLAVNSRVIKVDLEESPYGTTREVREQFEARIGGQRVERVEIFRVDPLPRRFEFNLLIPDDVPAGPQRLEIRLGRRHFDAVSIEIGAPQA